MQSAISSKIHRCWHDARRHVPSARNQVPWVTSSGSVSIIDTDNNILACTIETGKGYHQVAFSPENAYIANSGSDIVTVIRLS